MAHTKYKPEYDQMVIDHMAQGLSFESFAGVIDCGVSTIKDWANPKHPSFKDSFSASKKVARAKCVLFWEKAALPFATGSQDAFEILVGADGTERLQARPFSASTWIFNMKARFREFGWNENDNSEELERFTEPAIQDNLIPDEK